MLAEKLHIYYYANQICPFSTYLSYIPLCWFTQVGAISYLRLTALVIQTHCQQLTLAVRRSPMDHTGTLPEKSAMTG